jgi:hypothetical protein
MSTTTHRAATPLFTVCNHYSANCGTPPRIDDHSPSQYLGYFENQHGEQAVFVYDRDSRQGVLYLGDAGWEAPYAVVDGAVPDLVLSEIERLWVRVCWQAATANAKEV